jgi:hypothetical protein
MTDDMPKYNMNLDHLAEVEAFVTAPFPVGPSSWGTRLVFPVVGGTVKGAKLNGTVQSFGADWGIIRPDDCFELDVRIVVETDDGAFIHAHYLGIVDMTKEQADQFRAGNLPQGLTLYTTPRFETSHEKYQWLTRIQAVGRGGVVPDGEKFKVTYSWYALTT